MRNNGNIGKTVIKVSNTLEMNKFNVKKTDQFICDGKCSYLIYGETYWVFFEFSIV